MILVELVMCPERAIMTMYPLSRRVVRRSRRTILLATLGLRSFAGLLVRTVWFGVISVWLIVICRCRLFDRRTTPCPDLLWSKFSLLRTPTLVPVSISCRPLLGARQLTRPRLRNIRDMRL